MTKTADTRDIILNAATERILHYGYAKTTMSEIAKDCDMSAGNIYRFFASKIDIAEAMARNFATKVFQEYSAIARDKSRPPLERLKGIFQSELERTYELFAEEAKVLEVARVLADERPEFAKEELAQSRLHIVSVLKDGVESGEFCAECNLEDLAEMIQVAMVKFMSPEMISHSDIDQLRRELDGVFDLITFGFSAERRSQVCE